MANSFWKDYLTFSKSERISVYILVALLVTFIVLPYFYARQFPKPVVNPVLQSQLEAVLQDTASSPTSPYSNNAQTANATAVSTSGAKLFNFDPNKLDAAGFRQLGLRDKTIQTIINYRNKGGHFYKPEDISKIYGLHEDEAQRLIPYIHIENNQPASKTENSTTYTEKPKQSFKKIDINTATEEDWQAFPGIGEVLSRRIVKFRSSIHGFSSVYDVKKTYGMPDSVFEFMLPYLIFTDSSAQ